MCNLTFIVSSFQLHYIISGCLGFEWTGNCLYLSTEAHNKLECVNLNSFLFVYIFSVRPFGFRIATENIYIKSSSDLLMPACQNVGYRN